MPLAKAKPTQGLRQDFYLNDLRTGNWYPNVPTLMCGGQNDPTVFFSVNTGTMAAFWQADRVRLGVLDVNGTPGAVRADSGGVPDEPGAAARLLSNAGRRRPIGRSRAANVVQGYHVAVSPFCTAAARAFFSQF